MKVGTKVKIINFPHFPPPIGEVVFIAEDGELLVSLGDYKYAKYYYPNELEIIDESSKKENK